ncbi:type VII secretion target [Actinokineospora sp. UTMC 2448]|uniref:type VII secretion target n=1 Tax=Actinokineospora sp. UTMC 2448 TaxID=2268449 RepID=UPI0021644E20|nr:type VII secretion target [Actinokineospora sp. UTMC 2448]UVS78733.1 hypothetical protein Actkin_02469 [Actinokineospora sp. UTMC 2448]
MAPPKGYTINPDELFSHARAVAQMQQPLDRVVGAAKEACPDGINVAYGLYCQFFAMTLSPVQEYAEDGIGKIARAVDSAANQLIKAVEAYVDSDENNAGQLRTIGANLPENAGNGLIAKGTGWDWKNYNPVDGGPLTNMDAQNGGKGAGLVGNTWDLVVEASDSGKRNYGVMAGHIASMGADGAALAGDPLGTAVSWAAGWVMEHVKPFRLILDGLAGNPEMIKGASLTWKNMSAELTRLANHYASVKDKTGGWQGEAGESYRDNVAATIINAMKAAANLATVMSIVVGVTGDLVNLVRSAVRDITAQALGQLVSAAAKRFYKPPFEELSNVAFHLKNAKALVTFLIVFVNHFARQIPLILEACKTLANIIPKLDGV